MRSPRADAAVRRLALLVALALAQMLAWPARAQQDQRLRWDKKWGPMVPHKNFPKDCSLCHVPKRWDVLKADFRFDHAKETGYPLVGAHADGACLRCHNDRGPLKVYLSRGCSGCHVDPHRGSQGLACTRCHDQLSWTRAGAQSEKTAEHARTRFPLTGMHASLQCQQCHTRADAGDFAGAPLDCASCHQRDFQRAPNHLAMNFPRACASCHTTLAFAGASFNHAAFGGGLTCVNCHAADFQRAPNHLAMNFSQQCQTCHTTATWLSARFDHTSLGANPICFNCHQAEFNAAKTTPASNHAGNGFPTTCQNCHSTALWGPGTAMQHTFVTALACVNCHRADYNAANNPPHAASGYPTTCADCHASVTTWSGAVFNHTRFQLPHNGATCNDCHPGGNTSLANCTCAKCHGSSEVCQ